jgi:hypothetical protein
MVFVPFNWRTYPIFVPKKIVQVPLKTAVINPYSIPTTKPGFREERRETSMASRKPNYSTG